jgi:hypothetical protein
MIESGHGGHCNIICTQPRRIAVSTKSSTCIFGQCISSAILNCKLALLLLKIRLRSMYLLYRIDVRNQKQYNSIIEKTEKMDIRALLYLMVWSNTDKELISRFPNLTRAELL